MLIGLSGYARTGKDTVAKILVDNHGFERVAFADALKDAALILDPYVTSWGRRLASTVDINGWEEAKDSFPEVRRLLQHLGVSIRALVDEDAWVKAAFRKMEPGKSYVIPDVRFPNELEAVRAAGGLAVRIKRPGYGPVNDHLSEIALDGARFDQTISNKGSVAELSERVARLVTGVT